jgi:hypothetical protein
MKDQERPMNTVYPAEIHVFGQPLRRSEVKLHEAARLIRDRHAAAVLLDIVQPDQLRTWGDDKAFPEVTQHQKSPGTGKSRVAIGPTQRLVQGQLIPWLIDYFSCAARYKAALRNTEFVKLCTRELAAGSVRVGDWGKQPLVSKREYQPNDGSEHSVPPHCDAIHFGRAPKNRPIKEGYGEAFDQSSLFFAVKDAENGAALVMWDYRAKSRLDLDEMMGEHALTGRIERLEGVPKVAIRGRPGQLNVVNTRAMHAVEQCKTVRQTLDSFKVWHEGQRRMFH